MNRQKQSKARRQSLQSTFGGPQIPLDPNERNSAVMNFRAKGHHMHAPPKKKVSRRHKYYQESDSSDSDSSEYDSESSSDSDDESQGKESPSRDEE